MTTQIERLIWDVFRFQFSGIVLFAMLFLAICLYAVFQKNITQTNKVFVIITAFLVFITYYLDGLATAGNWYYDFELEILSRYDVFSHWLAGLAATCVFLNFNFGVHRKLKIIPATIFITAATIYWEGFERLYLFFFTVNPETVSVMMTETFTDILTNYAGMICAVLLYNYTAQCIFPVTIILPALTIDFRRMFGIPKSKALQTLNVVKLQTTNEDDSPIIVEEGDIITHKKIEDKVIRKLPTNNDEIIIVGKRSIKLGSEPLVLLKEIFKLQDQVNKTCKEIENVKKHMRKSSIGYSE